MMPGGSRLSLAMGLRCAGRSRTVRFLTAIPHWGAWLLDLDDPCTVELEALDELAVLVVGVG